MMLKHETSREDIIRETRGFSENPFWKYYTQSCYEGAPGQYIHTVLVEPQPSILAPHSPLIPLLYLHFYLLYYLP